MDTEIKKCRVCGKETTGWHFGKKPICKFCDQLDRLKSAQKTLAEIQELLSSGKAMRELQDYTEWTKRKTVELEFDKVHYNDPLNENLGEDLHILIFKGDSPYKKFVLIGHTEEGWWRRHGYIQMDDYGKKKIYRLKITSPVSFEKEYHKHRAAEALAVGVVEALRPFF